MLWWYVHLLFIEQLLVTKYISYCLLFLFALTVIQCEEPAYAPKPRAYPKVEYPKKSYQTFQEDYCSMSFKYPTYAKIEQDKYFFGEAAQIGILKRLLL